MKKKVVRTAVCAVAVSCALVLAAPTICDIAGIHTQADAYAATCKVSKEKVTVKVGSSQTISLKGITAKQSNSVKWSSTNAKIAKVKKTKTKKSAYVCTVTGVKAGKCIVKAAYRKKSYKCTVTVAKASGDTPAVTSPTEKVMRAIEGSASSLRNEDGNSTVVYASSSGGQYGAIADRTNNCIRFAAIIKAGSASFSCVLDCTDAEEAKAAIMYTRQDGSVTTATATVNKGAATKTGKWEWQNVSAMEKLLCDMAFQIALMNWDTTLELSTNCHLSEIGFTSL